LLGNGRLDALGDIILLGLRDYQDSKADVIQKYNSDEARALKTYGELPEHTKINDNNLDEDGDDGIEFQEDVSDDSEEGSGDEVGGDDDIDQYLDRGRDKRRIDSDVDAI
jgi:translation initiation factor 1A